MLRTLRLSSVSKAGLPGGGRQANVEAHDKNEVKRCFARICTTLPTGQQRGDVEMKSPASLANLEAPGTTRSLPMQPHGYL